MVELLSPRKHWTVLIEVAAHQIVETPEWLTPFLYSGVGYANIGETQKAIKRLEYVRVQSGGDPAYADAERIRPHARALRGM